MYIVVVSMLYYGFFLHQLIDLDYHKNFDMKNEKIINYFWNTKTHKEQ